MKNSLRWFAALAVCSLSITAFADDRLIGHHGGHGGSSGPSRSGGSDSNSGGSSSNSNADQASGRHSGPSRSGGSSDSGGSRHGGGGSSRSGSTTSSDQVDRSSDSQGSGRSGGRDRSSRPSRSGSSSNRYGTNHNNPVTASNRDRAYTDFPQDNRSAERARREDRVTPVYRRGYTQYRRDWDDDRFAFSFYQFDYNRDCAYSPWYGYSTLPGYVNTAHVSFRIPSWNARFDIGWVWTTHNSRQCDFPNAELERTSRDIEDVFNRNDLSRLEDYVDRDARVTIRPDRGRSYTVDDRQFFDLIRDAVDGTRTRSYRLIEAHQSGSYARLTYEHRYEDPWGGTRTATHQYLLRDHYDRYEIVEFTVRER